jgi:hypothetical protein
MEFSSCKGFIKGAVLNLFGCAARADHTGVYHMGLDGQETKCGTMIIDSLNDLKIDKQKIVPPDYKTMVGAKTVATLTPESDALLRARVTLPAAMAAIKQWREAQKVMIVGKGAHAHDYCVPESRYMHVYEMPHGYLVGRNFKPQKGYDFAFFGQDGGRRHLGKRLSSWALSGL